MEYKKSRTNGCSGLLDGFDDPPVPIRGNKPSPAVSAVLNPPVREEGMTLSA